MEFMRDRKLETVLEVHFFYVIWQAEEFKSMDPRDKVFSLRDKISTDGAVTYWTSPVSPDSNVSPMHSRSSLDNRSEKLRGTNSLKRYVFLDG